MRRACAWLLGAGLLLATGCYVVHPVRVDELTNVNAAYVQSSGAPITLYGTQGPGTSTTIYPTEYSKLTFHRPDGSTFTVRGHPDLIIETTDGLRVRFAAPVEVRVDGDHFRLVAPNQTGELRPDEIRRAQLRSLSVSRTMLATVAISAAFSLAVFGAIAAAH